MAKLYFYYAAMNAGKSTTLLQADFNYRERGMETMLWTASFDDRSGSGTIGSRIALSAPAHSYDESVDLFEAVGEELRKRKLDCILVDEAQFLSQRHVLQLCEIAWKRQRTGEPGRIASRSMILSVSLLPGVENSSLS